MLLVRNIRLPLTCPDPDAEAAAKALAILRVPARRAAHCGVAKLSVDARHGTPVLVYTIAVTLKDEGEESALAGASPCVCYTQPPKFDFTTGKTPLTHRPVVVGLGPAGLFAALLLARRGYRPLVLERGPALDERIRAVEHFEKTGTLDPNANIQFGEGGAGTFSDGKLTTRVGDPLCAFVTGAFLDHGAPADIAWRQKPHVGTDLLRGVIRSIRGEIEALGGEVRFNTQVTGLCTENGCLTGLKIADGTVIPCDRAVLAIGHSARDTFEMLDASGVPMEPKPFAMGVRIEQKQRDIDIAQYGGENPALPPADYKLVEHLDGETVYTFCMCPGGYVVAAASEEGRVVTNGMSYADRDGENANAALLVTVNPADFPYEGNLGGMRWQREIEGNAYRVSGSYRAPAQRVGDFLAGRPSDRPGRVTPTYRPGVTWCDLHDVLPGKITDAIAQALPRLDGKLKGFADPDAVMTAPETRSSSPVRIIRDSSRQSSLRGLYPTGEGAGYAGGIMSAAIDGIMTAETIIMEENYERETDQQMAP